MQGIQETRIYFQHGRHIIYVQSHRGEELFMHLAMHGIESKVVRINGHAQLELDEDVNLEAAQEVLKNWV